jgi:hypothetical protein
VVFTVSPIKKEGCYAALFPLLASNENSSNDPKTTSKTKNNPTFRKIVRTDKRTIVRYTPDAALGLVNESIPPTINATPIIILPADIPLVNPTHSINNPTVSEIIPSAFMHSPPIFSIDPSPSLFNFIATPLRHTTIARVRKGLH